LFALFREATAMEVSRFFTALRRTAPPDVPARADERPGADPGGSVIAAGAALLVLFLLLLAAAVIDSTVRVGGAALDPGAAWPDRGGDAPRLR
jgi:hypothetical protein